MKRQLEPPKMAERKFIVTVINNWAFTISYFPISGSVIFNQPRPDRTAEITINRCSLIED